MFHQITVPAPKTKRNVKTPINHQGKRIPPISNPLPSMWDIKGVIIQNLASASLVFPALSAAFIITLYLPAFLKGT